MRVNRACKGLRVDYERSMTQDMITIDTHAVFGVHVPFVVQGFAHATPLVPALDAAYCFDPTVTKAILAGFACNARVLVHGMHGTGKSSHITQVAARLNYPCVRLNLDGQISRNELLGRDTLTVENGQQCVVFKEAVLPHTMQRPCALVLDEYDAAPPEVAFVLQRLLEQDGALTLSEENRVIAPHPQFRLFATANTLGNGDMSGIYHGTSLLNQAQLDRWGIVQRLDYLTPQAECALVQAKHAQLPADTIQAMVQLAGLTRSAFSDGDLSMMLSPRTVLNWATNTQTLAGNVAEAFTWAFLNRLEREEVAKVADFYQRCFGEELPYV